MSVRGLLILLCSLILLAACVKHERQHAAEVLRKITFDVHAINDQGLRGPADGLVSVGYEFCIPAEAAYIEEVRAIDPSVTFMRGARGRIGCSSTQLLCVGDTHQEDFRAVLHALAGKAYIARIDEFFAE